MKVRPRLPRLLSSPRLTVGCLLALCGLLVWGTIAQTSVGLHAAQQRFFSAWVVFAWGVVPLPAVSLVITVLAVNLVAALCTRFRPAWNNAGLVLAHAGLAVLIAGAALARYGSAESVLTLRKGEVVSEALIPGQGRAAAARMTLPLSVRLIDFVKHDYRGTTMARDFESRLHVKGPGIDRDVRVSMNRPFRFRGYTFYQSSYATQAGQAVSTLAVVRNPARNLPYIAGVIITIGLALHACIHLAALARRARDRAV